MSNTLISLDNLKQYHNFLNTELETKQDVLTAGSNIKIEDGIISMVNGSVSVGQNPGLGSDVWIDLEDEYNEHYLTEESDPTVPSWAKETTKPTYTAQEVGAIGEDDELPISEIDILFEGIFKKK